MNRWLVIPADVDEATASTVPARAGPLRPRLAGTVAMRGPVNGVPVTHAVAAREATGSSAVAVPPDEEPLLPPNRAPPSSIDTTISASTDPPRTAHRPGVRPTPVTGRRARALWGRYDPEPAAGRTAGVLGLGTPTAST